MKKAAIIVLVSMLGATAPAGAAPDAAAQAVLDCMRNNIPKTLRVQEFELTTVDRTGGSRVMRGKLFAKREDDKLRAMIKIKSPPDLNGSAYMVREGKEKDDMYVFVPALNKVRRINGAGTDGPLFGTDFTYTDIKQMQNASEGGTVKLDPPETLEGRPVNVLAVTPKPGSASRYSLIRSWIDQKACVPLKIEFSEAGALRKRLVSPAASIAQAGSNWYVTEAKMSDLRDNTSTQLKVTGFSTDVTISDRYFNPSSFANAD